MQRKAWIAALVVIAAVLMIGGFWFVFSKPRLQDVVIAADQTITGDFEVNNKQRLVLANGAKLTVTGNLTVNGEFACQNGPIQANVGGEFHVTNTISCPDTALATGIAISAKSFLLEKTSKLVSAGSIQLVDRPDKILVADKADAVYDAVEQDSGNGLRVGPLGSGTGLRSAKPSPLGARPAVSDDHRLADRLLGIEAASAQAGPNITISGDIQVIGEGEAAPSDINVNTPPKPVKKVLLNFDFSKGNKVHLQDLTISGPAGRNGTGATGTCTALGKDGGDAMRFNANVDDLVINNFYLRLGDGGNGGNATTGKDCEAAFATGGNGGKAGNFKIVATSSFAIEGTFDVTPGHAGNGGEAHAYGKDQAPACPGKKGGDATATGGKGANANESLKSAGSITGVGNVTVHDMHAGNAGLAYAKAGTGGSGSACGCSGGMGGKASSSGGNGGNASGSSATAPAYGGNGGNVDAIAGHGGSGGSCGADKAGGNGGSGGSALAKPGSKGLGTTAPGADGVKQSEKGGNGGNGGNGCGPGAGGPGGTPDGQAGVKGTSTCVEPPKPTSNTSVPMIQAIELGANLHIPLSEVHKDSGVGCKQQLHWHANDEAKASSRAVEDLNGQAQYVKDFDPDHCGYGLVASIPVVSVPQPSWMAK